MIRRQLWSTIRLLVKPAQDSRVFYCANVHMNSAHPVNITMSTLHIKNFAEEERLTINLDLQVGNAMKTFNLNRLKSEELGLAIERLRASLAKKSKKKTKRKKKAAESEVDEEKEDDPVPIDVLHSGNPISLSTVNDKAWINGAVLRIGSETISAVLNPPSVKLNNLCSRIMKGYPLFPEVEYEFCDVDSCKFYWKSVETSYVDAVKQKISNSDFEFSDSCTGFSFAPSENDVGKHILLICVPKNSEKTGKMQAVLSQSVVTTGPEYFPFEKRHTFTQEFAKTGEFRVISYNILAEVYTSTELAEKLLFVHLPKDALDMSYRKQLLLKEIIGYRGDMVCLQEVDRSIFHKHLSPGLLQLGYEGFFTPKRGGSSEGCATFIRTNKFKVVNHLNITLSEYLSGDEACKDLWEKISEVEALKERVEQRSSVLQVTVVESVDRPGQYVCLANTHLYFHLTADHIRLIHAATALRYLQAVCSAYTQEGKSISLVFCGDFNSCPDCGVYQLMTTGFVDKDQLDWSSGGAEETLHGAELSHPMSIVSACGTPDFTHYGAPMQGTLDYIFVEASRLDVVSSVPLIDVKDVTTHTYLPNPLIPSDHLALVSNIKFKS